MINLSIIIPVGNYESDFRLINQIKEKFKGCEIILVVDESNEFIIQEKIESDQLHLLRNSSRAKALNKGVDLSTRDILWFLHLDSDIENINSSDLNSINKFALTTFLLKFNEASCWWIAAGANIRTKAFSIPFGDQSFLITKKLFNFIGPFNENLLEGEDHEFIWRIKSLNIKLDIINKHIVTSAKKYINNKIFQTLKTLSKTVSQTIKFRKQNKSVVLATFLKDPKSNESKSRLRRELNNEFVNQLNKKFINITNQNLKRLNNKNKIQFIKVCKDKDEENLKLLSNIHQGKFLNQDQDLSLVMSEVSELALKTVGKVALLGSDIPTLNSKDLNDAFSKKLEKENFFLQTDDGGFCFMLSKDQNIINCLSKIQSSTTSVMKTLRSCLNQVNISKTIYSDVDITLDLKKVYDQLKLNEAYVTNEQKDLLNFLRSNEKIFI